jgi:predicted DNA-binding protein
MPSQTKRRRGRPPAGPRGEKVSSYPQMTIRLPLETRAKLNTLSLLLATPMWQIVDQAINVYVTHLPKRDQEILGPLVERLARGEWPVTSHWRTMWDRPAKATTGQHAARPSARRERTR